MIPRDSHYTFHMSTGPCGSQAARGSKLRPKRLYNFECTCYSRRLSPFSSGKPPPNCPVQTMRLKLINHLYKWNIAAHESINKVKLGTHGLINISKPHQNKQAHQHIKHTRPEIDVASSIEIILTEGLLILGTHGCVTRPSRKCIMGWIGGEQELPTLYPKSQFISSAQLSQLPSDTRYPSTH